ncbi:MAG: methyl-accepting chemotaxis protein [Planctomycetota bacterium]
MRLARNLSLKKKIWIGLGSLTFLISIVAGSGWFGISGATRGFKKYRELARDSNLCGGLQTNMLMVRMNVKDFLINSETNEIAEFEEYFASASAQLAQAQVEIEKPARASSVDKIESLLKAYEQGFQEVVLRQTERNEILNQGLNKVGPEMEQMLSSLRRTARDTGNLDTANLAGTCLHRLLLARLSVVKFFNSQDAQDADHFNREFAAFGDELGLLAASASDSKHLATAKKLAQLGREYRDHFAALHDATERRQDLIDNTLDRIGPEIASLCNEIRLSVKADQDELGPQLKASNQLSQSTIGIVGILALSAAFGIAVVLSRLIIGPLVQLSDRIQMAQKRNDLTVRFPTDREDEIGVMASCLNSFVENLQEAVRAIGDSTLSVVSASTQLKDTASELSEGARETRVNSSGANQAAGTVNEEMDAIAQSTSEMNRTFETVSHSIDQLSLSIQEISENAADASSVAGEAAGLTESSRQVVSDLDVSANEIGEVISVIEDIAEQTSLLALNATIEAARAGAAGKGFAVVAAEVKELACQTAAATDRVRKQIGEMQKSTGVTVDSIHQISEVIQRVNATSTNIAAAVEEQSLTTNEINKSVSETTQASHRVSAGVERSAISSSKLVNSTIAVEKAAESTAKCASQTRSSGESLSQLADEVSTLLARFKV